MFFMIQDCTTFGTTEFLRRLLIKLSDGKWPFLEYRDDDRRYRHDYQNEKLVYSYTTENNSSEDISDYTTLFSQPETTQSDELDHQIRYEKMKIKKHEDLQKHTSKLEIRINEEVQRKTRISQDLDDLEHKLLQYGDDIVENGKSQGNHIMTKKDEYNPCLLIYSCNKDLNNDQEIMTVGNPDSNTVTEHPNALNRDILLYDRGFLSKPLINENEIRDSNDLIDLSDVPEGYFDTYNSQISQIYNPNETRLLTQINRIKKEKFDSDNFYQNIKNDGQRRIEDKSTKIVHREHDSMIIDKMGKYVTVNDKYTKNNTVTRKDNAIIRNDWMRLDQVSENETAIETNEHIFDKCLIRKRKEKSTESSNSIYSLEKKDLFCLLDDKGNIEPCLIPEYNLKELEMPRKSDRVLVISYRSLLLHDIVSLKNRPIDILILNHQLSELLEIMEKYPVVVLFKLNPFDMSCVMNIIKCKCIVIGNEGEKLTCKYGVYYLGNEILDI